MYNNSGHLEFRIEKDSLGEMKIPASAYYGIHTARAKENFTVTGRTTNIELMHALAEVKKAAALAHVRLDHYPCKKAQYIAQACDDVISGMLDDNFIIDSLQGGAGTSANMNINEVIANRAIELMGGQKGDYSLIDPLHHVNCCQSTNDVYPTALRIAAIRLLRPLSESFARLQHALQKKENEYADVIKLGRTQLMDALPMMAGQGFGAWARAIARDRWRLYKVEERLREVNIGGTAIGTGMNASLKYIFLVTDILQDITGLGLARSEFPMDPTQNNDVFVEVSGLLKSAASNLIKICNDIRLLASGPAGGIAEIKLKPLQAGSSIMPGKVNPVIPEMAVQVCMKVIGNDNAITMAAMSGQLELNAFTPLIADLLLESLKIMHNAVAALTDKCIETLHIDKDRCRANVEKSSAIATALVHHTGYEKAAEIAKKAQLEGKTIKEIMSREGILAPQILNIILEPYQITKPGIPGKNEI